MSNRIKIAWICHFSSEHIQSKLPIWKESPPFAAWITNTLEGFKNSREFEIHVISPHQYLKRDYSFEEHGIFYHFFSIGVPFIHRSWPSFFNLDLFTNFYFNKRKIGKIIRQINPRLINLQGAENSYYSASVLDLYKQYPTLVTIQGFVGLEIYNKKDRLLRNRIEVENSIINNCKYFGGDNDSKAIISSIKQDKFEFYNYLYPLGSNIKKFEDQIVNKEFDLLFWSRICKDKGAEDFIKVVAKLKNRFSNIKACFIGPVSSNYLDYIKNLANELGCNDNIHFKGFIRKTEDLYIEVLKCKMLILPTFNDRLPTVLREALYLKLPVISYVTGSIPDLNIGGERILLAKQGDINKIAYHASNLMLDQHYFDEIVNRAYLFGIEEFGIKNNCSKISNAYRNILDEQNKKF